jgi:hypothetical protein
MQEYPRVGLRAIWNANPPPLAFLIRLGTTLVDDQAGAADV